MFVQDDGNPAEAESLRDGDYVAVRRFVRILERGDDAKGVLDAVVDQCGSLINLRTAIMRYRKPKRWFTFYRCILCLSAHTVTDMLSQIAGAKLSFHKVLIISTSPANNLSA